MFQPFLRLLTLIALLSAGLAGCAMTPPAEPPRLDPDAAIVQADALVKSGQHAKAIELLDRAAHDNPVNAKPWLRKAQLQFDHADYPAAIVSAEEAVKRDGSSEDARSVAVVAALRIAIRSLTELRGEQNLDTGAQAEAQRLAVLLRESLSTDLLVPPEPIAEPAKKPYKRPARRAPAPAPERKAETAAAPKAADKPATSSDPFEALRN